MMSYHHLSRHLSRHLSVIASILIFTMATAVSYAAEEMSAEDFVEKASSASLAEIRTANLALEKAQSNEVKNFAKKIISDHTNANEELKRISEKKKIPLADEADILDMAKSRALETREGRSFDAAYMNNQIDMHTETIELFRDAAANLKDKELNMFAKTKIPILEQHLKMSRKLADQFQE